MRLVLLRHAEATKNIEHRHGGDGTNLTPRGMKQASQFAKLAEQYFPDTEYIGYVPKPQCDATARIVGASFHFEPQPIPGLLPFHLGVLDGLSDDEARERYPHFATMIDNWRLGLVEISEVKIQGATDMNQFFEHGVAALHAFIRRRRSAVLVGTRSVLVMMWNILRQNHPRPGGNYFERPWDNCEWVEFVESGSVFREARNQRHSAVA